VVELDLRLGKSFIGLILLKILFRNEILLDQRPVPFNGIRFKLQISQVFSQRSFGFFQLSRERPRIDSKKKVAY